MPQTEPNQAEKGHKTTVDTVIIPTILADTRAMARAVLGVAELIISSDCAEIRAEKCQEMATEKKCRAVYETSQVTEDTKMAA